MSSALADSLVERYLEPCLSCLSPRKKVFHGEHDELGGRSGIQKEMRIAHHQPHLVPPMKLVVYDDMPSSPQPVKRSSSRVSIWTGSHGNAASRASSRMSQTLMKRRRTAASARPAIPRAEPPIRRLDPFRPLELSIYLPNNRLSDLPEFNLADFNAIGEIQLPPRALVRAKSEAVLARTPSPTSPRKAYQSMIDDRSLGYWRSGSPGPQTSENRANAQKDIPQRSSVVWNGLPGLPISTQSEEATSHAVKESSNNLGRHTQVSDHLSVTLTFPPVEREEPPVTGTPVRPPRVSSLNAPVTPPASPPSSRLGTPNGRVSQWLNRTSTMSTVASRRSNRSPSKLSISAPIPIPDRTATMSSIAESKTHSRTRTTSTSTVASTALESIIMDAASVSTFTTMNSTPIPPMPKKSTTTSDSPLVTPRQNKMARQTSDSSSHWNYLPAQYAEVWKRETIVSEADVGMAI